MLRTRKKLSFSSLFPLGVLLLVAVTALAGSSDTLPRKSPPFTITQPSGEETHLYHFRGKVVVMEFLFVRSPHCLQLAEVLNKLNHDFGARGFQPLAVAFGPYADPTVLNHVVEYFRLTYPVGYTTSDKVDAYLGRSGNEVLKIPQLVVIDRKGLIRATSGPKGDPSLENEASLRALVDSLLKESGPARETAQARDGSKGKAGP